MSMSLDRPIHNHTYMLLHRRPWDSLVVALSIFLLLDDRFTAIVRLLSEVSYRCGRTPSCCFHCPVFVISQIFSPYVVCMFPEYARTTRTATLNAFDPPMSVRRLSHRYCAAAINNIRGKRYEVR